MTRKVACLAATMLLFAACGGDGDDEQTIVGDWVYEHDNGYECATLVSFYDDGDFELDVACALSGGGYGVEAHLGTYEQGDGKVTIRTTHSTCPGDVAETWEQRYSFRGDQLQISDNAGSLILEPLEDGGDGPGGGAELHAGCWADDGTFTPSALTEL